MPDQADAKLADVQLALATLTEAFAIALERHSPGTAAVPPSISETPDCMLRGPYRG